MTARTIAQEKRIVCDSCDMGSGNAEGDRQKTTGFYIFRVAWMCLQMAVYLQCQHIASKSIGRCGAAEHPRFQPAVDLVPKAP